MGRKVMFKPEYEWLPPMCSRCKSFGNNLFDYRVGSSRTWVAKENHSNAPIQPGKEKSVADATRSQAEGLVSTFPDKESSGGNAIVGSFVDCSETLEDEALVMMYESEFSTSLQMVLYEGEQYIRKVGARV